MKGYLYISYDKNGLFKETKLYDDLCQIKSERGIGISDIVISRTRVAKFSSDDGSGCYVIDFLSDIVNEFNIDTKNSKHLTPLLKSLLRDMKLDSIGIE